MSHALRLKPKEARGYGIPEAQTQTNPCKKAI